ncbi:MAG: cysteine desulfurase family protein [Alphaproteobacteria bacterium]
MTGATVYLDYNATTPVKPAVAEAVARAFAVGGNPSSVHRAGRLARRAVEEARLRVAELAGAEAGAVIFTSGGTEANNLALKGAAPRRLLISAIEHDSILAPAAAAAAAGAAVTLVPVDEDGIVDLAALERALAAEAGPALVSVMLANNESGVVQPVAEVARRAHDAGAIAHCDAVQAPGRLPLDMAALGVDLLTLSAHKLGGPQGVGALVAAGGTAPSKLLHGGGQELGRRAGTENVPGIVGFGVAAELAAEDLGASARTASLRDDLEARLAATAPELKVFGRGAERLVNTSCFALPGLASETQVMALDLAGVAVSAGAACSSGKVQPSHVLRAMAASEDEAGSAIRVSLGWGSSERDIDRLVEAWSELYCRVTTGRSEGRSEGRREREDRGA